MRIEREFMLVRKVRSLNWKWMYKDWILYHILPRDGTYVVDEKWDNLIILDACRYDTFREANDIKGKLEIRVSRGSDTVEFLTENFLHHPRLQYFEDIIYVAANPFISVYLRHKVFQIYPVWDYGWNDSLNTVLPRTVVEDALRAHYEHPQKRLIVHFVQPHSPYVGLTSGDTGFSMTRNHALSRSQSTLVPDITMDQLLERGVVRRSAVVAAYVENLKMVFPHVKQLISKLKGITVVTSDHGNMFGERPSILYPFKVFSHPSRLHVKPLTKIPWLVVTPE